MSPKDVHAKTKGLGWYVSEDTCRRIIDRGGAGAAIQGVGLAAGPPLSEGADHLDILRRLRSEALTYACAKVDTATAERVKATFMDRAESLTKEIRMLEKERAPDKRSAILVLPPERAPLRVAS